MLTALNADGTLPLQYPAVAEALALDEVEASLQQREKRGRQSARWWRRPVARLKTIVAERAAWEKSLAQVKRMQQWVLDAEHILDGSWAKPGERRSLAKVGRRFDRWRKTLTHCLRDGTLSPLERECLEQFLQVLSNLRSHLIQCYDHQEFPRTNNEMERRIRGRKHALSPHQRPQELEQLSVALWALRSV